MGERVMGMDKELLRKRKAARRAGIISSIRMFKA